MTSVPGNVPTTRPRRPVAERDKRKSRLSLRPRPWWLLFAAILAANWALVAMLFPESVYVNIPYTTFKAQLQAGNIEEVVSQGDAIQGTFKTAVTYPPAGQPESHTSTRFTTQRPAFAAPGLEMLLEESGVVVNARPLDAGRPYWQSLLLGFGPTALLIGAFLYMSRRMSASGAGSIFGMGRSRAKRYSEEEVRVTFDDVAGIEEAKHELVEIVDFLRNPEKYQRLGGMVPKGVLLVGAPGTGKTLLARAVAGEAGVPFFSLSASEFIEMIVGVGAARVRDLFKQAREAAPAIIFVDELDAVGRARGGGPTVGTHDEREQTLNQILTEMDGFDSREGVIVLAATNRADVLDQALMRPGRFDRRVVVQRPDRAGRAAILRVHSKQVPLGDDVDLDRLAIETPGLVGAELRNLVNEAALHAARKGQDVVHMRDFSESMEKILLGPARNVLLSSADRERTAYHEAGHALLGLLVPGSDPVHRVTIVPRGMALGVTYQLPTDDRTNYPEDYLRARIVSALGGRAAERLVYGVVTSGAENDLRLVSEISRQMVLRWGMSEKLGAISFVSAQDEGLPPGLQGQAYSEATAELIDEEIRRIVDECHREADRLLATNRERLTALAEALLEHESLDEEQILQVTSLTRPARSEPTSQRIHAAAMAGGRL